MTIKVDMHVHTSCSSDSLIPLDKLLATCDHKGIDCVAVTDHNTAEGAIKLHEQAPDRIIIGEEIRTTAGEIAGLFLQETIPAGLSPLETIEKIKEQGGLVYLTHPFDFMRGSALEEKAREEIWEKVDIVEIFNSRNILRWSNWKAEKYAKQRNIPAGVGSDAHSKYELGMAYVIMEQFSSADDFLANLSNSTARIRKTPITYNFVTKMYKVARGIG